MILHVHPWWPTSKEDKAFDGRPWLSFCLEWNYFSGLIRYQLHSMTATQVPLLIKDHIHLERQGKRPCRGKKERRGKKWRDEDGRDWRRNRRSCVREMHPACVWLPHFAVYLHAAIFMDQNDPSLKFLLFYLAFVCVHVNLSMFFSVRMLISNLYNL